MTISAAKPFETANLPWEYGWKEDRQPSKHGSIEDLLAHSYTASEVALNEVKKAILPICPDALIEISRVTRLNGIDKLEKDYMRLKDVTIHDIGPNMIKTPHSTARKLAEDSHKDIDNIGDSKRFRIIVPKYGPSKANKAKSIKQLMDITRALTYMAFSTEKETSNCLDITSYKNQILRPSDEGFRDFKCHFTVRAPSIFPEIRGIEIPDDFKEIYKDVFNKQAVGTNAHVRRFDNIIFADLPISCELQILHESVLDAEKITDIIRAQERSVALIKRSSGLFGSADIRGKSQHDVSNLQGILRRLRSNVNNGTAELNGLNELVAPEFMDRTLLCDIKMGRSTLASNSITNITRHETIQKLGGSNIIFLALKGTGNNENDEFRKISRGFK